MGLIPFLSPISIVSQWLGTMLSRSLARSVAPLVSARAAHTDKHMPDLQYFRKQTTNSTSPANTQFLSIPVVTLHGRLFQPFCQLDLSKLLPLSKSISLVFQKVKLVFSNGEVSQSSLLIVLQKILAVKQALMSVPFVIKKLMVTDAQTQSGWLSLVSAPIWVVSQLPTLVTSMVISVHATVPTTMLLVVFVKVQLH